MKETQSLMLSDIQNERDSSLHAPDIDFPAFVH